MLNKRQEIFQNAIDGKLRVEDRASERMQDRIIEEVKDSVRRKTEEALQIVVKEHELWMYQNEKEEAKRLQGVRKLRQDEEIARAPPRNMTKWPDWEEARKLENGEWRLEPEGEAEVPEIIIVQDAVEETNVDLDVISRGEQVEATPSRRGREMLNEGEKFYTRPPTQNEFSGFQNASSEWNPECPCSCKPTRMMITSCRNSSM